MKCTWYCDKDAVYQVNSKLKDDNGNFYRGQVLAYNCEDHVPKRTAKDYYIEEISKKDIGTL